MQKDVYERGLATSRAYVARTPVVGRLVATLDLQASDRGLNLISPQSRAVLKHEIHELMTTAQTTAPGSVVDDVSYLGFFEVQDGGIILVGDRLEIGGRQVGRVAGFDLSHFPNHMNIVLSSDTTATGQALHLQPGDTVVFFGEDSLKHSNGGR